MITNSGDSRRFGIPSRVALWIASFLLAFDVSLANEVIGCGGFVQASSILSKFKKSSDIRIDYSEITIELKNSEGLVKETNQCAPNGYYFLPVYDKGSYIVSIKGPNGWSFEPTQVPVVVDETCNGNQDINFQFTGFTVWGRILGAYGEEKCYSLSNPAPIGVTVTLTRAEPELDADATSSTFTVLTTQGGRYDFNNLLPGKYHISASHPRWNITLHGSSVVNVGWGNVQVEDIFNVQGYDVSGYVKSQANPVSNSFVFLYSDSVKSVGCPYKGEYSPSSTGQRPLCHSLTDDSGRFYFSSIPCGHYSLVPYLRSPHTVFNFVPASTSIFVSHESFVLPEPFQVSGFSILGQVADYDGQGIEDVKIYVNGELKTTTSSDGSYTLERITSSSYNISAEKDFYTFTPLENFLILTNLSSLPAIKPYSFDVCGKINLNSSLFSFSRKVHLYAENADVNRDLPIQSVSSTDRGEFSFQIKSGNYKIIPEILDSERKNGLVFRTSEKNVLVYSKPVFDIVFEQDSLSVSGQVKCKPKCDNQVKITLTKDDDTSVSRIFFLKNSDNSFLFEEVLPGNYSLQISKEISEQSKLESDPWCWKSQKLNFEIFDRNISNFEFVQTGWNLQIRSTHEESGVIVHDTTDPIDIKLKVGYQSLCVLEPGAFMLLFIDPCIFFGALMFTYDTDHPKLIDLVGKKIVIQGEILVNSEKFPLANNMTDYIFPRIYAEGSDTLDFKTFARLKSKGNSSHVNAVYEYGYWADFDQNVTFIPYHNGRFQELTLDYEMDNDEPERQEEEVSDEADQPEESLLSIFERLSEHNPAVFGDLDAGAGAAAVKNQKDEENLGSSDATEVKSETSEEGTALKSEESLEVNVDVEKNVSEAEGSDGNGEEENTEEKVEEEVVEEPEAEEKDEEEVEDEEVEEEAAAEEEEEEEEVEEKKIFGAADPYHYEETFTKRNRVLFYPRYRRVYVGNAGCLPSLPPIEARPGVYLEGEVNPPLEGVNISVTSVEGSPNGGWFAGQVVFWILTNSQGKYVAGPLYDDSNYTVSAHVEGYNVQKLSEFNFLAQKLCRVSVKVKGGPTAEASLSPVLISLSSEDGFRKNAQTDSSNEIVFEQLFPGKFYIRPVLKEYSFVPPSLSLELTSGEDREVVFEANRIAYSVSGTIRSLSGVGEGEVLIEAKSQSNALYESTKTESNGYYRLRGLKPNHIYTIQPILSSSSTPTNLERASPSFVDIQVSSGDVPDVDFIVFDISSGARITGTVEGPDLDTWQPHIVIEVLTRNDGFAPKVVHSVPLPLHGYFEVTGLPAGNFSVRPFLTLPDKTHWFESDSTDVELTLTQNVHVGRLRIYAGERKLFQNLTPSALLPIVLSILVILIFASLSKLKDVFLWLTTKRTPATSVAKAPDSKKAVKRRTY